MSYRSSVIAAVLAALALHAQETPDPFASTVQPVLAKYCYSCHGERMASAGLNFQAITTVAAATAQPQVWRKTREKLNAGLMPPRGTPAPSKSEVDAVRQWIDPLLAKIAPPAAGSGRILARRLNRVEYDNTIRDLLGIAGHPSDDFPVDDSGYGFDNIADVLTVSPMLMEKYLAAARKASQLAVFGATYPAKPVIISHQMGRRSYDFGAIGGVGASAAGGTYLPYSMRGNLEGKYVFPVDAEYEIRFRVMNLRSANANNSYLDVVEGRIQANRVTSPDAPTEQRRPPTRSLGGRRPQPRTQEQIQAAIEKARTALPAVKLVLLFDGKPVLEDVIEGDTEFGYARGEFVAKIPVKAGEHVMRVSFPELSNLADPRTHLNTDQRRKIFADYLDVVGPINPASTPPASYTKIFTCGHAPGRHNAACSRRVLTDFTRRAWRRPVTAEEVTAKVALAERARKQGDSFEESIRLAIEAILASPNFLFKIEREPKPGASPAAVTDHELAVRLSYFLWSSMPDEQLSRLADSRTLRQPAVLEAQLRRMAADPRARNLVDNFAAQWLQLRSLGRTKPDGVRFGTMDDELIGYMRTETELFVQSVFTEDRSLLDLIDAPYTFLNGPLARHYGIPGVDGEAFRRVAVDPAQRGGLLGQSAVLTVSSYPTRTSIPVRGKWVLENLLGAPPPPPPPDAPTLVETGIGKQVSLRQRLEQHRNDPSCSGCHSLMDPIGFGLESFDAVGKWRTKDGAFPIDTSGTLPDGQSFNGVTGLRKILRGRAADFTRNLSEKLLTFALGRGLESFDHPTVDRIAARVATDNYRFSTMLKEIVLSDQFQLRTLEKTRVP